MIPFGPRPLRLARGPLPLAARSHVRHFHPTKPAPWINEALDASAAVIHGVHNTTSLPWVASIPLTALLVRTVVGLPLQMYIKSHARRERDIAPLKQAWATWSSSEKKKRSKGVSDVAVVPKISDINRQYSASITALQRRWNISTMYRFAPFLQLPVWIMFMESIRGMSGNKNGLIPWLLSLVEGNTDATNSLHLTIEPTFANEGALWFPDLLAGDSTGILPVVLATSILLNIQTGWKSTARADLADMPRLEMFRAVSFNGLRLFVQILSLNVGLSSWFYEMPVALIIYWISSSNIATLQTYLLEKNMFMKPPLPLASRRFVHFNDPNAQDPFQIKLR